MNKTALFLLLAFGSVLAFSSAHAQAGKVTRLMTKDLLDVPGKEGMVETVDFAPGRSPSPIDTTQISSCMCWKEASLLKWRVVAPRHFTLATSFTNLRRMYTS